MTIKNTYCVAIIGTGFGGLGMAIQLKQAGIDDFVILEKAASVGGVWRENSYPGAACDVPSHLYSFSFEPNPSWTRKFSPQPEIKRYLEHCERKYGLNAHIRFNTFVQTAVFEQALDSWEITTSTGDTINAKLLVKATGQLSQLAIPKLPGLEQFAGKQFHSAHWDHDYDLQGKRVAIVGTGASALQFIPHVVEQAAEVTVFQRTSPWVIPKPDRPYTKLERWLFKHLPLAAKFERNKIYWSLEWRFAALSANNWAAPIFNWVANRQRRKQVKDPALQQKLTPDYPLGCNRILLSNNYYSALSRDNVEVVAESVKSVTGDGVVSESGETYPVDAIIFGTGFAATEFVSPMTIVGLDGQDLNQRWAEGAEAYYGMTVSGFPNFFMLYGPNTNLGHNSIIFMLESQIAYVLQCVKALRDKRFTRMDLLGERMRQFNQQVQAKANKAVWNAGCNSWYRHESGKNTNNWPDFTLRYRALTRRVNFADYQLQSTPDIDHSADNPKEEQAA